MQREALDGERLDQLAVTHSGRAADRACRVVDRDVGAQIVEADEFGRVGDRVERVARAEHSHLPRRGDNLLNLLDRRRPMKTLSAVFVVAGPVGRGHPYARDALKNSTTVSAERRRRRPQVWSLRARACRPVRLSAACNSSTRGLTR